MKKTLIFAAAAMLGIAADRDDVGGRSRSDQARR